MIASPELMQLAQILNGGFGGGGMAPLPQMNRSNPMYNAVASPDTIMSQIRGYAGPMIGQMLGMQNVAPLPSVAPGQGIGEAWYASRVSSRQWELSQQHALDQMGRGFAGDAGRVLSNMGVPAMLGMSPADLQRGLTDRGASSAGQALVGQLASLPAVRQLMGGSPLDTYANMFSNRSLFGNNRVDVMHPLNREGQEFQRQVAVDLSENLTQSIRGAPGGGYGMLPNLQYTRGFSDDQLSRIAAESQAGGRYGDLGGRLMATRNTPKYGEQIQGVTQDVGQAAKMFEALGDMVGSRDMDSLVQSMNKLTSGRWPKMDFGQVTRSIRELEATAQVLGRSKEEMLATVTNMQNTLQGSMGVSANQAAIGLSGGGLGGFAAAANMTQSVFSIAHATGAQRPQDIERIQMQQAGLMSMGVQSSSGRASQLIEYLNQEGAIDPAMYARATQVMSRGTVSERKQLIDEVSAQAFGSAAEGRQQLKDPMFMRMMQEKTGEEAGRRVVETIRAGQATEWRERQEMAQRSGLKRMTRAQLSGAGLSSGADPNAVASEQMRVVAGFYDQQGPEAGGAAGNILRQTYDAAVNEGSSPVQAMQRVRAAISSNSVLKGYAGRAFREMDIVQTGMDVDSLGRAGPAKEFTTAISDMRSFGAVSKMSEGQQGMLNDLQRKMQKDPAGALSELNAMVETLPDNVLSKDQKAMVRKGQVNAKATAAAQLLNTQAARTGWQRASQGGMAGLSQSSIEDQNSALTNVLKSAQGATPEVRQQLSKDVLAFGGVLNVSETERIQKAIIADDQGVSLKRELDQQGRIKISNLSGTAAALTGRGLPLDYEKGMDDQQRSRYTTGRVRSMAQGMAGWNQMLANEDQGLRATFGQLGLSFAEGNIDARAMLGISADAPDTLASKENDGLRARWQKLADKSDFTGFTQQYSALQDRAKQYSTDFVEAQKDAGSPEAAAKLGAAREAFYETLEAGGFKSEKDVDAFLAKAGVTGAGATALKGSYQTAHDVTSAQTDMVTRTKEAEALDPTLREDTANMNFKNQRADRKVRRNTLDSIESNVGDGEGTGFIADLRSDGNLLDRTLGSDSGKATQALKKELDILVPDKDGKLTLQQRQTQAAKMFSSDRQLGKASTSQLESIGRLSELHKKQEDKGGTDGKGDKEKSMRITGTMTVRENGRLRDVNVNGRGYVKGE